jgi:GTP-binding protein HflX
LPHALVAAFHATLEETANADLLLHVVDSASEDRESQIDAVNEVLEEIGAGDVPQIMVFNKIDLTRAPAAVNRDEYGKISGVFLSAASGEGLPLLRDALAEAARGAAASGAATQSRAGTA